MVKYNQDDLPATIEELRDSIALTLNASLALCWLVELFNAMQARKQSCLCQFDNDILLQLITYRNLYVHTGKFRATQKNLDLGIVQNFANKYCYIYIDFSSKTFDTV